MCETRDWNEVEQDCLDSYCDGAMKPKAGENSLIHLVCPECGQLVRLHFEPLYTEHH